MSDATGVRGSAVRVLVVDDQRIICDGIASLLSLSPLPDVVGTAANGQEAIAQAAALHPDVVLMDIQMPLLNGIAATEQIRRQQPTCQVLVLTTFDDEAYIVDALAAGAAGYVLKNIPAAELVRAILAVHAQLYLFDHVIAGKVVAALRDSAGLRAQHTATVAPQERSSAEHKLTERELGVLRLLASGASNREIAATLFISESTVKAHISSLLGRLGVRDRTQAALYAHSKGWL